MAAAATASPTAAPASSEETIAKLRDVAYGRNSTGEFREPSARVREAAKQALVLMGEKLPDGGKGPSPVASASPPAGPQSQANLEANRQVDYRAESSSATTSDVLPLAPQPPGFPAGQMQLAEMQLPMQAPSPAVQPPSPTSQPPSPGNPAGNPSEFEPTNYFAALEEKINASSAPSGAPIGMADKSQFQLNQPTDTASGLADTNTRGRHRSAAAFVADLRSAR